MASYSISELEMIRAREAFAGGMGLDAKRPTAWQVFGYSPEVTFPMLRRAYDRSGAAAGAVHRILDGCWREVPRVRLETGEGETAFETGMQAVMKQVRGWAKLRELDRRNMVGNYAAIIYRVADNLTLDQPMVRASALVDIVPVWQDQIAVERWDEDPASATYGKPLMFSVAPRDTREKGQRVHHSRVQLLAEGSVGDFREGVPLLEAGFNALVDIEKITGGSAESYLKNSSRTLNFAYRDGAEPEPITDDTTGTRVSVRDAHELQARRLNTSIDAAVVTSGADVSTLQTSIADPTGPFMVAAQMFAAAIRIPFTILFGQQTGRLASDEDKADFASRIKSRQENELTPMLTEFVSRMQAAGIFAPGAFVIEWADPGAPTDEEKLAIVGKMVVATQQAMSAGIGELFTRDELRRVLGYEPLGEVQTEGGDIGDIGDKPQDKPADKQGQPGAVG